MGSVDSILYLCESDIQRSQNVMLSKVSCRLDEIARSFPISVVTVQWAEPGGSPFLAPAKLDSLESTVSGKYLLGLKITC